MKFAGPGSEARLIRHNAGVVYSTWMMAWLPYQVLQVLKNSKMNSWRDIRVSHGYLWLTTESRY